MEAVVNTILRSLFVAIALLMVASSGTAQAQELDLRFKDYEERLNAILKTRLDAEREFVQKVVAKVKAGTLPERLVETSFKWVLNKRPDTNYPFVYFERVLRLQAKKLELEAHVPRFDYDVYRRFRAAHRSGKGSPARSKTEMARRFERTGSGVLAD